MGIDIHVRIELTRAQRRVARWLGLATVSLGVTGIGVALAAPAQWTTSEPLTASKLNGLTVLSVGDAGSYSVGATMYCGVTPSTNGGLSTVSGAGAGLRKAKHACETACASATAHMCTGDELARSAALGTGADGWYLSGSTDWAGPNPPTIINGSDCQGFTQASNANGGAVWQSTGNHGVDSCDISHPVVCCD